MLLIRLLAILSVIAVAASLAAWLLTGNRKYLRFGLRLLKVALAIVLVFFGLMILERLIVIV
jgi:hypothetical protein